MNAIFRTLFQVAVAILLAFAGWVIGSQSASAQITGVDARVTRIETVYDTMNPVILERLKNIEGDLKAIKDTQQRILVELERKANK